MSQKQLGKAASGNTDVTTRADVAAMAVRFDAAQSLTLAQQAQARANEGSAASGANNDITSLGALTTPILTRGQVVALALGSPF